MLGIFGIRSLIGGQHFKIVSDERLRTVLCQVPGGRPSKIATMKGKGHNKTC